MAQVSIRNITKRFGKVEVIHGIDLEIADGELVVLVGPSGCGKSTTLRMIAGLEEITSGEIAIADRVVNDVEPKDRDIAMVFQNYAIYPHMSVHRNIGFGLRSARLDKAERDRRIREAAAMLDLTDLLERRPSQLSGGQRQRVAIGRAMVRDPAVFLFDEPLSNLDAQLRAQMRLEIKKLHQRLGSTIVFVTHDQIEAMTLADRIVIMRDGHIQQVGTPTEVYLTPRNVFVARFIGSPSMNMLAGRAAGRDSGVTRLNVDGLGSLTVAVAGMAEGQAVTVGVRPDDLVVVADGDAAGDGDVHVTGEVQVIEPLGPGTLVYALIDGHEVIATASGRNPPAVGATVTIRMRTEDVHVFDAGTEQALT